MIIGVESLDKMFARNDAASHCTYEGKCYSCGCDVEVEITKTSGGYGLQGGALYEPNPQNLLVLCKDCYEGSGVPVSVHLRSSSPAN